MIVKYSIRGQVSVESATELKNIVTNLEGWVEKLRNNGPVSGEVEIDSQIKGVKL